MSLDSINDLMMKFEPESVYIDRIVSPIWYVIGIIGNLISAKVWLGRKQRQNSSAIYLGVLGIVHTIFLIFHFSFIELSNTWEIPTNSQPVLCEASNVLLLIPQYLAPLLVLGFTVERYIAVCHPFKKESFCTVGRAVTVISCLTVLACIIASVQVLFWKYFAEYKQCYSKTELMDVKLIWDTTTELLFFLVVPLCVLMLNILVIREIKRITSHGPAATSGGSQMSTVTILSVSFYFICTLIPASVVYTIQNAIHHGEQHILFDPDALAADETWQTLFKYLAIRKVVEEICLSNFACYFFIYYITGKYFRREVNGFFGSSKCCKEGVNNIEL